MTGRAELGSIAVGPSVDYGAPRCVNALFEAQVARSPEAVAVEADRCTLTYAELDAQADRWASLLQDRGAVPGTLVGVLMRPSGELIAALLGILKAGCAYVPLDPGYPPGRLRAIVDEAQLRYVVADEESLTRHAAIRHGEQVLTGADAIATGRRQVSEHDASRLAYIMYTSGSTGRPKGVMVSHASIFNRLAWDQQEFVLGPHDVVLQQTSPSFDISVWEIFAPLARGSRLVVADPDRGHEPEYLAALVGERGVTIIALVPSLLEALLDVSPGLAGCPALRDVFCGGEALPTDLQRRFSREVDARLTNFYGPTEATVDATFWRCDSGERASTVPLGRPIANVEVRLLGDDGEPVPWGQEGEIVVAGACLARGYLGRGDLTAESFVVRDGVRMYRTGDVGRLRDDGALEFLGRRDDQVKVRGFRVELAEIDAALRAVDGVRQAVSAVVGDRPATRRVVAWVVPHGPGFDERAARAAVGERLPRHMVPARIVEVQSIPLTSTGKLDRRALPEPSGVLAGRSAGPDRAEDVSDAERQIAAVFGEVLGLAAIGRDDSFFDLGGTSLEAARVVATLRRAGVEVSLRAFFDTDTAAGLARITASPAAASRDAG